MASIINIETPDLGGAQDVTVIEVLVKPGDKIEADANIVTLESDKATLEVPSSHAGRVKTVKVKEGDKVSSGSILLTLEADVAEKPTEKTEPKTAEKPAPAKEIKPVAAEKSESVLASTQPALTGTLESTSDIHAGPFVRRLARELGVDLTQVAGSGPKQRVLREDVQAFVKSRLATSIGTGMPMGLPTLPPIDFAKFGPIETQSLSRIKKIAGKNLQRNWMMIPHVTQFGEADITTLEAFRAARKIELEKQQIKLTPLVFIMKAVVASLKAFPQFNASLDASGENLILKNYFHVGVAVDTPDGLVVPVIRDVDKKGLSDLAQELAVISEKARKKQLAPGDMQGGCFSISSLGGIGGTGFTPIINYPEVAILGVSKTGHKPVYQADGTFSPRLMLPLSLSYDHRVIDGADGARFIVYLTTMLSDIRNLLL
ncbi:MAG: dihydrolipoyllysine-residue acetyltransferase [Gammaproteobacteria bacterium RIFCSPHIGHO2_12_FULL_43_28]|nr:MAG: dihydrolipoyllysine-residue acetyltransferase [Gammaproteobacteria bacterium RIFCSPHIGHO2_12_FULL_43_28]